VDERVSLHRLTPCILLVCPLCPLFLVCLYPSALPTQADAAGRSTIESQSQSLVVSHMLRQSRSVIRQESCQCRSLSRPRLSDSFCLCLCVLVLFAGCVVAAVYRRRRVSPPIPIPSHMSFPDNKHPFSHHVAPFPVLRLCLPTCHNVTGGKSTGPISNDSTCYDVTEVGRLRWWPDPSTQPSRSPSGRRKKKIGGQMACVIMLRGGLYEYS
jgi:hypothetical protein